MVQIQPVIGKAFPEKVIPLIDEAKHSIKIIVFDWRWYPQNLGSSVQLFNQSIIRAARRGVEVKVLTNIEDVVKLLKSQGIKAKKLFSKKLLHAKMMLLDDENLVIGSHNYTQSAFEMNQEVSAIICGAEDLLPFVNFFNNLYGPVS
jgi:phosphatidylserine/phosphatidylglycerophosphate/cardiolipin synthase-like enzyme